MKGLHLGIVKRHGAVINHRSLLKIVLNPFLRCVGLQVVSLFDGDRVHCLFLQRCESLFQFRFLYDASGCEVVKVRRLF